MKRLGSVLLTMVLIAALTLLAACGKNDGAGSGGNGQGGGSSGGSNDGKSSASGGKPVELTFWGDWGGEGQKQFETMVDAFNKSQDRIRVKYVLQQDMIAKFLTAATSGGSPDILFWDRCLHQRRKSVGVRH